MKSTVALLSALTVMAYFGACSQRGDERGKRATAAAVRPSSKAVEHFNGEVVRRNGEYRFKLSNPAKAEPGNPAPVEQVFRLSRSRDPKEFASDEIHLRKYFGKTIVVKGILESGWIAKADIVGQWNRPGETRGPTLTGPEPN